MVRILELYHIYAFFIINGSGNVHDEIHDDQYRAIGDPKSPEASEVFIFAPVF